MTVKASYLVDLSGIQFDENSNSTWIHALPIGAFKHPVYGTMDFTMEKIRRFAENVKNRVRGIDPSVNIRHGNRIDGDGEAAGWIKSAEVRSDGLWVFVEFVKSAAESIKEKKWRYFSAEIYDEWENNTGQKFQDVLFGGALTNRPFMKNLVPINLSEVTIDNAFELVSAITGTNVDTLKGGTSMELDEKDLNKIIEGVATKLSDKFTPPQGTTEEPKKDSLLKLDEIADLKKLAETNPLVAGLMKHMESQGVSLVEREKQLRETEVTMKMAEFDKGSKLVLSPAARNEMAELLHEMPVQLSEKFWDLMKKMRDSQSFLVELGERAGAGVKFGYDKPPSKRFEELTNQMMAAEELDYATAVTRVAAENPKLWDEYRNETFING